MNVNMWEHPATQANLEILRERGVHIVEPGSGYLACGMVGAGRLADPEQIVAATLERLGVAQDLAGETVLITAGPTHEPIDPVRYLGNRSSGKMGYALAEAALRRGAKVILVSGPTALKPPSAAETIFVETAQQMRTAVLDRWEQANIIIMAAAVADYHVKNVSAEKIKRNGAMELQLEPNADILADLGSLRQASGKTYADADRLRRRDRKPAGERARQADQEAASTPSCSTMCRARYRLQLRSQRSHDRHRGRDDCGARSQQAGNCDRKFWRRRCACGGSRPFQKRLPTTSIANQN